MVGAHIMLTTNVGCEGQAILGPVGHAATVVSTDAGCEGQIVDVLLGCAWP